VNNCRGSGAADSRGTARSGEVIVSRGELIEIGDGFRIPEIMEQSGAVLREVGTTNRTRLADYENAIHEKTRLLSRVYPSNFTVTGFTEKPEVADLIALGARTGLPVVEDLGSGCLVDLFRRRHHAVHRARKYRGGIFAGALQRGQIAGAGRKPASSPGKKELVAKVRRHPLFPGLARGQTDHCARWRSLCRAYLRGAWNDIPSQRMIRLPLEEIAAAHQEIPRRAPATSRRFGRRNRNRRTAVR